MAGIPSLVVLEKDQGNRTDLSIVTPMLANKLTTFSRTEIGENGDNGFCHYNKEALVDDVQGSP